MVEYTSTKEWLSLDQQCSLAKRIEGSQIADVLQDHRIHSCGVFDKIREVARLVYNRLRVWNRVEHLWF